MRRTYSSSRRPVTLRSFRSFDEFGRSDPERPSESDNVPEAYVSLSALDPADVSAMYSGEERERLLRESTSLTFSANSEAESFLVSKGHVLRVSSL
jgi:hypothetical protein